MRGLTRWCVRGGGSRFILTQRPLRAEVFYVGVRLKSDLQGVVLKFAIPFFLRRGGGGTNCGAIFLLSYL